MTNHGHTSQRRTSPLWSASPWAGQREQWWDLKWCGQSLQHAVTAAQPERSASQHLFPQSQEKQQQPCARLLLFGGRGRPRELGGATSQAGSSMMASPCSLPSPMVLCHLLCDAIPSPPPHVLCFPMQLCTNGFRMLGALTVPLLKPSSRYHPGLIHFWMDAHPELSCQAHSGHGEEESDGARSM